MKKSILMVAILTYSALNCIAQSVIHNENYGTENENSRILFIEGTKQQKLGNLKEAITKYSNSVKLDKNYLMAYDNLAACYLRLDKVDSAKACCMKGLSLDTSSSITRLILANVYQKMNLTDSAVVQYHKIKYTNPDDPEAYYQLAKIHLAQKNPDSALNELFKCEQIYDKTHNKYLSESQFLIGYAYMLKGNTDENKKKAIDYFMKAHNNGYNLPPNIKLAVGLKM